MINSFVTFSPAGGSTDDAARFASLATACSNKRTIVFTPGTYLWKTTALVPSGTVILGNPGVTINQQLANNNDPTTAGFLALHSAGVGGHPSSNITAGTFSFASNTNFGGLGTKIIVQSNNFHMDSLTIVAQSGSGPYNYNVDKPFSNSYTTGDTVAVLTTQPTNIDLNFGGATLTGTGTRFFEFVLARNCIIRNLNIHVTSGNMDLLGSFDTGSVECAWENITVRTDPGLNILAGLALETNERSRIVNCIVFGTNTSTVTGGFSLYDCVNCEVRGSYAYGCVNGVLLCADGDTLGCLDCKVIGGSYNGNAVGVNIIGGSSRNQIIGVTAQFNSYGLSIAGDTTTCLENKAIGCTFTSNSIGVTNAGIINATGAKGTQIEGCDVSGNGHSTTTGFGIATYEDLAITNLIARSGNGAGIIQYGGSCRVWLTGFDLTGNPGTAVNVIVVPNGSELMLSSGVLRIGASCNGINNSGILRIENIRIQPVGVSSNELGLVLTGNTCRIGSNIDLDSCFIPIYDNNTGLAYIGATDTLASFGRVTANGTSSVDVNYPEIKSTDKVLLSRLTDGGTPGHTPRVTITAGTKFTINGTASDTSIYAWKIV